MKVMTYLLLVMAAISNLCAGQQEAATSSEIRVESACPLKDAQPIIHQHGDGSWAKIVPECNNHGTIYSSDGSWAKY